ncbi:MAG: hypothetical protein A3F67_06925 [Verrucomicrobia bacterium RIFCSPHIGHO2_12_FULL_41_10]|nr:MAG: hypothetical protein A3F67_06925 [Verrucomicrobia bacterium RIFCSPHIGHO2_12_FULL_41_10]HLB32996.1 hypothetical protein [Chthoniobacterales bacterium]
MKDKNITALDRILSASEKVNGESTIQPTGRILLPTFLSLFIHVLFILLFFFGFKHFYSKKVSQKIKNEEPPPTIILDLSPTLSQKKATVDTASEHPLEKAPQNASFEAHENNEAASELPITGSLPLPTQQGREQDVLEFKNQEHSLGEKPETTTGSSANSPATDHSSQALIESPQKLEPHREPSPSPTPATITPSPSSSPLPIASATPEVITPQTASTPLPQNRPVMGKLSSEAKSKGYQPESHSSVIHGAISNKGRASVATEATPIGRYKKNLSDAIGSRWYYYVDERMGLLSIGTATIAFYVNQQGHVEGLRVVSNTSNQTFADCSIKSIIEAKLPVIPPEVAATLQHGKLEIEYSFTIYSN